MKVIINQHDLDSLMRELKLSESEVMELLDRLNASDNLKPFISLTKEMKYHLNNGWLAKQ
jgi:hypothetical protein|tara:strand:+ start:817 stop:996 length:180 start_codon:yes stop_codon:yes gene_type:complete